MSLANWMLVVFAAAGMACAILRPKRWKAGCSLAIVGVAVFAGLSWVLPRVELPAPLGRFGVGTSELLMEDASRPEMHTANPLDHRALMVRVWYPTQADTSNRFAPYWLHARDISRAINEQHWPLGWLVSHLDEMPTHSRLDAPLAEASAPYPVLVFSHGLGVGYAAQNTALMEALASRGYVIFAIDHPYDGLATAFPDGRVAQYMEDAYEPGDPDSSADFKAELDRLMNSTDVQALLTLVERSQREQPRGTQLSRYWIDVWSRDQRFVIDEIERLQAGVRPGQFAGRLDLQHLGVFGMSFGGIAASATCATDRRCKAGINMDGFVPASADNPPQQVPFMYFANARVNINLIFMDRDTGYRYYAKVPETEHLDFTDLPALSPLLKLTGISGATDAHRMLELMNDFVAAFFDRHLRDGAPSLLEQAARKYPDVKFVARSPGETSS
jgi:predicted dienelactone hydrolase